MAEKVEGKILSDGLKWEMGGKYSRSEVVVATGNSLVTLEVVGKITASGKVVPLDPSASDGSEAAAGFMFGPVDASAADAPGVMINNHAMASMSELVWPEGITTGEKDTAIAELEALGIKAVG